MRWKLSFVLSWLKDSIIQSWRLSVERETVVARRSSSQQLQQQKITAYSQGQFEDGDSFSSSTLIQVVGHSLIDCSFCIPAISCCCCTGCSDVWTKWSGWCLIWRRWRSSREQGLVFPAKDEWKYCNNLPISESSLRTITSSCTISSFPPFWQQRGTHLKI